MRKHKNNLTGNLVNIFVHIIIVRSIVYRIKVYKQNKINNEWKRLDTIIKNLKEIEDLDKYYHEYKHIPQIEHQVGRFKNMLEIVKKLTPKNITIVEFGTWQGLGILMLDLAFSLSGHTIQDNSNCTFVGVDTFSGLPESSSIWTQGQFNDTSIHLCEMNIKKWINPASQFELISGRFNDTKIKQRLDNFSNFTLFHFDADLGSSTKEALYVAERLLNKKQKSVYFLFDDWGCHPDEVPDAFHNWYLEIKNDLNLSVTKISSTKYTRYYRIDFN